MSDIRLESEIKAFYGDIKATEDILSYDRENIARMLKNGLGDEIKEYINNPPKPNYVKGCMMKLKRWWNNKKSGE
jgi:hypothetical protein